MFFRHRHTIQYHVENNHNFIREILSNEQDWSPLSQEKNLMLSHINSTPRESL